jgi:hypothetical protein
LGAVLAVAAIPTTTALARSVAAPQNSTAPTISGTAREGSTVTANNGTWTNSPTTFTYQWQRCDSGGASCTDITGATTKTYSVATSDVDHTLAVTVTAANADGNTAAHSKATAVVSSAKPPVNTALPAITGKAQVGQELSSSTGTWTGGASSYAYEWERCDTNAASCAAVVNATGSTYGVRNADTNNTIRVVVTAKNASGPATATSAPTGVVTAGSTTTTTTTTTTAMNKAPTVSFVSLRRSGNRIYVRFKDCDDSVTNTVIARDTKAHVATATHRFAISSIPCGTHARNWLLPARFRHGRYTATLRAVDNSGASSPTVSRSLTFR